MATYAIGDIQGCFSALHKLLEQIQFDPARDRLWFVGDLVNRGPDSLAVLRVVKGLGNAAITILGNHDLHLLAVWSGIATLHRKDTFREVLVAPDCEELLSWLRHRPLIHRENGFLLVHAGLLPHWTAAHAVELAHEVEAALQRDDFRTVLPTIYYRNSHAIWGADLTQRDRLGLITNILTRLRVCSPTGIPDFSFKGPPNQAPKGYIPWFQIPNRVSHEETIIFGHWSALGVMIDKKLLALDGGCVWGRELVGISLENRQLFRVSCSR